MRDGIEVGLVTVSLHPGDPRPDEVRNEALPVCSGVGEGTGAGGHEGLCKAPVEVGMVWHDLHQPYVVQIGRPPGIRHGGPEQDIFCPRHRLEMAGAQQHPSRGGPLEEDSRRLVDEPIPGIVVQDDQPDPPGFPGPSGIGDPRDVGIALQVVPVTRFRIEPLEQGG